VVVAFHAFGRKSLISCSGALASIEQIAVLRQLMRSGGALSAEPHFLPSG
jgi:hypothetical protein